MSDQEITSHALTLYVVPDCQLCERARRELRRRGADYAERDVTHDFGALRRMYKLTKQRNVPVIEFDGIVLVRPSSVEMDGLFGRKLMRLSRNQLVGALLLLLVMWFVILWRFFN